MYLAAPERGDPSRPSWVPDLCHEEHVVCELVSPIEISPTRSGKTMNNQIVAKEVFKFHFFFLAKLTSFCALVYCWKSPPWSSSVHTHSLLIHSLPNSKGRKESAQRLVVSCPLNTKKTIVLVPNFAQQTHKLGCEIASENQGAR